MKFGVGLTILIITTILGILLLTETCGSCDNATISFQKNIHQQLPIASLTKLMTLYIIMSENDLNDEVLITQKHLNVPGSKANLKANTSYSVLELIKASLLNSSNQAAMALAEYNAESAKQFVEKIMNIP